MVVAGAKRVIQPLAHLLPQIDSAAAIPQIDHRASLQAKHDLHFAGTWMDMMLWQIRIHTHLLGAESDPRTIARYNKKFVSEVEPQLAARLEKTGYICGEDFSAVDCVMGQNVMWARAYDLCQGDIFKAYIGRLSSRPAFAKAYSDLGDFSLAPPAGKGRNLAGRFSG